MKKICSLILGFIFVFGLAGFVWAQEQKTDTATEAVQPVYVGNKICPVSGEKIDEKLKATYEYEGKIYNFCCAMCIDEFKKDPEKYIKKVEEEMQKEKAGQKTETPSQMQGHEMHGQEHN